MIIVKITKFKNNNKILKNQFNAFKFMIWKNYMNFKKIFSIYYKIVITFIQKL